MHDKEEKERELIEQEKNIGMLEQERLKDSLLIARQQYMNEQQEREKERLARENARAREQDSIRQMQQQQEIQLLEQKQELDRLEAALIFTEYDLPLAASEEQLLAARQALARNEPAAADKNLVAAEESIQFVTLGGSASLAGARTHLIRAAKNYADEYYAAAREDLAQASEWLRRAGAAGDEKSRQEARKLAAEIDALKDKLDVEADDYSHTLGGFVHRNWVMIEREAEDLWVRYKRQQAAPGLKVTTKAFGVGRRMPIAARFEP